MHRLLGSLVVVVLFTVTAIAKEEGDAKKGFPKEKLVGEWGYVSGVRAGEQVPAERLDSTVTFAADTVTIPAGPDKFVMAYKIDDSSSPAKIDLEIKSGPVNEGKAVGIIAFDGEQLKLCYDPAGMTRPTKFESTKDNGAFLFVLKPKRK